MAIPKQVVEGSNPFARSRFKPARRANLLAGYVPANKYREPTVPETQTCPAGDTNPLISGQ